MEIFQTLVEDTSVNFTEVHFDMAISICEKALPGAARRWDHNWDLLNALG